MHAPIRHRGPDGEGFLTAGTELCRYDALDGVREPAQVVAGFRRLNILDLTPAAAQPMLSSRPIAILFNGEIYNFRQLREELRRNGREFKSSGDTEVALAAYEEWGTGCFERLEGMWSIVIVDLERRKLVLSRDRFGIKPLYWAIDGKRLLIASEAKQIIAAQGSARVNPLLLGMFLRGVRQPTLEETFFAGIRALPPATWSEIAIDGDTIEAPSPRRYWDLDAFSADAGSPPPYEEAVERFETLLREAVASHRIADVKVGTLLSGGLDSSTLAVMLSEFDDEGGRRFPTFSFGFRDREPDACELPYVDAVVQQSHLVNHETTFDSGWVRENLPRVVYALEEPILGIQPMAQYRVLQLARERGSTVVFDGQGADEVLGGYPYHQLLYLVDLWRRRRVPGFTRELRAMKARDGGSALGFFFKQLVLPSVTRRLRSDNRLPAWIEPSFATRSDDEFVAAVRDRGRDASDVNRQIHFDVRWGNAKTVLGFGDRNGMAHSLEVRVPYFDRKLVEFAMTLPDHYKVSHGDRKRILRDVARKRLPKKITERGDRNGFMVPTERWMRNGLWQSAKETITDSSFASTSFFRPGRLQRLFSDYQAGRGGEAPAVWRLHSLAVWKSVFNVTL